MKPEARRLLAVNCLYALIPVLLLTLPHLMNKQAMEAYGARYSAYMVGLEFAVIALPTLIYFLTPWGRDLTKFFWAQRPTWAILLMVPLAFCAYFLVNGLTVAWLVVLNALGLEQVAQTVPIPQSLGQLGIAVLIIALSPALCEEFFFRGTLQPVLTRHMKPWAAIVLCGCLFGLIHGQLAALPGHVLLGVGLCLVAYLTRSIWYTVVWHFLQNAMAVGMGFLSPYLLRFLESAGQTQMEAADAIAQQPIAMLGSAIMLVTTFGTGTALFLVLLWLATRSHRKAPVERAAQRPPLLVWLPLLVALGCAVYLYVVSGMQMVGGGV